MPYDIYAPYKAGLRALLEQLGRDHPRHADVLVYQQRLTENVAAARRYGDTESRRAERAEIVDHLNALALEALDVSYTALCEIADDADSRREGVPTARINTGGGAYVDGDVHVRGGSFVGRDKQVIISKSSSSPDELLAIQEKLDRLLEGQHGLRRGQGAIYRRLDEAQRETVAQVLDRLQQARLDDAEARRELHSTVDAVRRALIHLQMEQIPPLSADVRQTLDEVTEVLRADVDLRTGLELTVPLIPFLLSYKTVVEAGTGIDLRQLWEDLKASMENLREEG